MKPIVTAIAATALCAGLFAPVPAAASADLAKKHNCLACHQIDKKSVGPAYRDIAAKYKGNKDAAALLAGKVKKGGGGVWGPVPMPPNAAVPDADVKALVAWILSLQK